MRRCTVCQVEKEDDAFHWHSKAKNRRSEECASCMAVGKWPAESYKRVHNFSPAEEYIITKLAAKPTLSAALDAVYRRNPRRWHQLMVAAILSRKEAAV